jgi:NADH-quinone oxidoreductase subunit A
MLSSYVPLLVLLAVAAALVGVFMAAAQWLGPRCPNPEKDLPYESGLDQERPPGIRFDVKFYRVALLFLVFDLEAAFFYPWAVLYRDLSCQEPLTAGVCLGSPSAFGLLAMTVFVAILLLALAYVWKKKALEWG